MPEPKSEFENTTGGYVGAQVKDHNGRMKGTSVRPGQTIWLDEDEQIATANAPRRDEDNPFEGDPPMLKLVTAAKDIANRRPIGHTERPQVNDPGVRDEAAQEAPEEEGGGGQSSDAEGAAPAASEEPSTPAAEEAPAEPEEKPEEEMSEEEKRAANAKAAAARAVPPAGVPSGSKSKAAAKPAAAPKGQRAPEEQVATPEAEGK